MAEDNKHWRNKVESITAGDHTSLVKALNKFYMKRFVIATQIWSPEQSGCKLWVAIVYYKISPEQQEGDDIAEAEAAKEQ